MNGPHAAGERLLHPVQAVPVIRGAERLLAGWRDRDEAVAARALGSFEQLPEEGGGQVRHVAGHNEVPGRRGMLQRSLDAPERAAAGYQVRYNRVAQAREPVSSADQHCRTGGGSHFRRNVLDEARPADRKQGFVASHACAGSSRQNVAGAPGGPQVHGKMIALMESGTRFPASFEDRPDANYASSGERFHRTMV